MPGEPRPRMNSEKFSHHTSNQNISNPHVFVGQAGQAACLTCGPLELMSISFKSREDVGAGKPRSIYYIDSTGRLHVLMLEFLLPTDTTWGARWFGLFIV